MIHDLIMQEDCELRVSNGLTGLVKQSYKSSKSAYNMVSSCNHNLWIISYESYF